jgi:acyl-CoA synthetase (AMP-forming)/AMP-acid ligase II
MRVLGDIPRLNSKRYPQKKALIMGDHYLTFGQLNDLANRLAHGLLSLEIRPGDRVAVMAENCLEFVVVNYAVAKCGAVLVPLNFRYKKAELVYAVNNSEPQLLFYGPEFVSLVEKARGEFAVPVRLVAISGEPLDSDLTMAGLMEGRANSEPFVAVNPESPAVIIYTSGTTGVPKGVLFSHVAYFRLYDGLVVEGDIGQNEVVMVGMPLFHNGGLNAILQPTLMMGNTALIMGRGFDPDEVLDAVGRYGVTMVLWVPTQLAMMVNYPGSSKYDVSTLRKIWYGSSVISPLVLEASMDLFKSNFYQWYGQCETGMVTVLRPEDHVERYDCTGREMFNADIRVVDREGQDTPLGEAGEIISAQKPLGMIAYYKMEEATRETIREGWIHTGDVARVEGEGYLTIVGRTKDMIISGAENIYPKEIEDTIITHPGVEEVAVIGIPDEVWGESVCAVVVAKKGYQVDEATIIEFCAARLSGYKKPKRVEFREELPKNAAGKVTKNVLREPFWAGRQRHV